MTINFQRVTAPQLDQVLQQHVDAQLEGVMTSL